MKTKLNKVVKGFKLLKALNNSSAENSQEKEQELIQVLGELGVFFEKKPTANGLDLEPLDESQLKPLDIPENASKQEIRKALEAYLKQFQGKTIQTSDGKTVRFSGKSTAHLANDATKKKEIMPRAIAHVIDVLKAGQFIERQQLYKERKGGFVAFHVYRKWVDIGSKEIHMQVKAGELDSGILEAGDGLLVYAAKDVEKAAMNSSLNVSGSDKDEQPSGDHSNSSTIGATSVSDGNHHTAIFDDVSSDEYIFIEILAVREKNPQASDKDLSDEDKQFLKDVADGKIDVTAKDVEIRIKSLCDKIIDEFSENQTLRELLREALEACRQKALSLTDTFLTQQNIH